MPILDKSTSRTTRDFTQNVRKLTRLIPVSIWINARTIKEIKQYKIRLKQDINLGKAA